MDSIAFETNFCQSFFVLKYFLCSQIRVKYYFNARLPYTIIISKNIKTHNVTVDSLPLKNNSETSSRDCIQYLLKSMLVKQKCLLY